MEELLKWITKSEQASFVYSFFHFVVISFDFILWSFLLFSNYSEMREGIIENFFFHY